jgi:hypothetical protein
VYLDGSDGGEGSRPYRESHSVISVPERVCTVSVKSPTAIKLKMFVWVNVTLLFVYEHVKLKVASG